MARIKDFFRLQRIARSKRFLVTSVTLLFIIVSAGAYFTFYISNQTDYFNNRNFRQLNSLSDQVSTRVVDLKSAFRTSVVWSLKKGGQPDFKKSLETIQGVNFVGVKPDGQVTPIAKEDAEKIKDKDCTIDLRSRQGAALLEIKCVTETNQEFRGSAKFAEVIGPFLDPDLTAGHKKSEHEEGFDDIVIAAVEDRNESAVRAGDVIFDQGTPELALTSLNNLQLSGDHTRKLDFTTFSQTTNSEEVRLGGGDYKIYAEPLEMTTGEKSSHWIICGLVESDHFRHQTWAISYTVLIVLGFLMSLVPLSWPFLKILFIGPKDRLRLADVYFVSFSLVIGVAVMTLFIFWVYTYSRKQNELNSQLASLSDSIVQRFDEELGLALSEIDTLNQRREKEEKNLGPKEERDPITTANATTEAKVDTENAVDGKDRPANAGQKTKALEHICARPDRKEPEGHNEAEHKVFEQELSQAQIKCLNDEKYPFFNVVFWTDDKGNQKTKWLVDSNTTNPHKVNSRPYFTEIVNGRALDFKGQEFWIAPQSSSVTGSKTVVISRAIRPGQSDGIIAMGTSLPAVMDAITPPGFGYRIIDSKGMVQLQSSETQQWKENFFDEGNNDRVLRSTVAAHIENDLDISYKGRAHSIRVTPLKHSPGWSLIVIRDKQPLRTIYLEILTVAGSLFLTYAIALLIVFVIFYLVRTKKKNRNQWIWPSPDSLGTYYRSILLSLLFCALSLVIILNTSSGWTVLFVSLIAFVGIAGFLLRLKLGWVFKTVNRVAQNIRLDRSFDYSRAYIANLVVLVILVGMIPALAFFKVAHSAETLLFVKDSQLKLAQSLMARQKRITDQYSSRKLKDNPGPFSNEEVAKAFIDRRIKLADDVYAGSFYETSLDQQTASQELGSPSVESDSLDPLLRVFVSLVPFYNQTSAELWGRTKNASADNSWVWESADSNLVRLRVPREAEIGDRLTYLSTNVGKLSSAWSAWPLATAVLIVAFVLLLALLSYLTRFIVRKVFLLDFEEQALVVTPVELSKAEQNLFVVTSSAGALQSVLRNGKVDWVNLEDESVDARFKEIGATISPNRPQRRVVFEKFEHGVNNSQLGSGALNLIEQLLGVNGTVVIVSGKEPSAYRWSEAEPNGPGSNSPAMEDRWAEVAGQLMKVYFTESCCADDFENVLLAKESEIAMDSSLTRSQKRRIQSSIDIVRDECGPRLVLRRIGKEILRRPTFHQMRPAEVARQIGNQSRLYYRRLWENLSDDEKLTLFHLAEDRLLSPNDPDIDQLILKRFIVRSPDVRLLNDTFKDFVLGHCFTGRLASAESEAKQMSPWEKLKLPLLIGLTAVTLFLVITQKEFLGSSLSLITGLTSGIPAVFKLLSFLQSQGAGQKVLNSAANQLTS